MNREYKKELFCEKCLHNELHEIVEKFFTAYDGTKAIKTLRRCCGCGLMTLHITEVKR